jgi:glycosyltransferase involved in cell wall biosynthesis
VTVVNEYVPNELLAAFLQRADVVVLPYKEATQSGVLQLAFGAGTPVITTTVGGLPEVVTEGETGLLIPPHNPLALAQAIERYFADDLAQKMRPHLQKTAAQFSWATLATAVVSLAR